MNTYADSKLDTLLLLQTSTKVFYGIEDTQTSTYCTKRIVFMGLRIAKVHEESIP
jgi:hypothetical protein